MLAILLVVFSTQPGRAALPGPQLDPQTPDASAAELARARCLSWRLSDGIQLPEQPELYRRKRPERAWGHAEMIRLLSHTAEQLAWLRPSADPMVVGDISLERGGRLDGHASHQGGLDADLGLYFDDGEQGRDSFADVKPAALDVETNWLVIKTLLDSGKVDHIFLDQAHIDRIRAHALATGDLTAEQAAQIFPKSRAHKWQPGTINHSPGHSDHLHLRIRC